MNFVYDCIIYYMEVRSQYLLFCQYAFWTNIIAQMERQIYKPTNIQFHSWQKFLATELLCHLDELEPL